MIKRITNTELTGFILAGLVIMLPSGLFYDLKTAIYSKLIVLLLALVFGIIALAKKHQSRTLRKDYWLWMVVFTIVAGAVYFIKVSMNPVIG